ncbi:MAG: SRPBCC family protein [Gordonia sp. (in: high G+C Gram-positive bacteria)]
MAGIRESFVVEVPRAHVFAYINDYANVPKYMFGVSRFEPTTEQTSGLGAVFDSAMTIGPKTFGSTVEITEWEQDEVIRLESIAGFSVTTVWRFADDGDATVLDAEFDYRLPGGLGGRALKAIIEPFVGQAIKQTKENLRTQLG